MLSKRSRQILKLANKLGKIQASDILHIEPDIVKAKNALRSLASDGFFLELESQYVSSYARKTSVEMVKNGIFQITSKGEDWPELNRKELLTKWIPYIITTSIAVAALIIALWSLLLQI